jgi:hypothetical protein
MVPNRIIGAALMTLVSKNTNKYVRGSRDTYFKHSPDSASILELITSAFTAQKYSISLYSQITIKTNKSFPKLDSIKVVNT